MGMDQYLLIPFLGGWTSIYQLFWCSPVVQGFDTLPYFSWYNHIYVHEWLNDPMLQAIWQRTWAIYKPSAHEMFCLAKKLPRSLNAPEPNILVYQFFFVKHPAIHSQKNHHFPHIFQPRNFLRAASSLVAKWRGSVSPVHWMPRRRCTVLPKARGHWQVRGNLTGVGSHH